MLTWRLSREWVLLPAQTRCLGERRGNGGGLAAREGGGIKSDAILLIFRTACRHPAKLQWVCLKGLNMWINHFTSVFFQLKQCTNHPASPTTPLFMLSLVAGFCFVPVLLFSLSVPFLSGLYE